MTFLSWNVLFPLKPKMAMKPKRPTKLPTPHPKRRSPNPLLKRSFRNLKAPLPRGSAIGYEPLNGLDPSRGRGEFIALEAATGKRVWVRRLPQPVFGCATVADGVVFTSTFDGTIYAFDTTDGSTLWTRQMRAGVNACPSLAGDLLLVGAGIPRGAGTVLELAAFSATAR